MLIKPKASKNALLMYHSFNPWDVRFCPVPLSPSPPAPSVQWKSGIIAQSPGVRNRMSHPDYGFSQSPLRVTTSPLDTTHCATTPTPLELCFFLMPCLIPGTWWVTGPAMTFNSHNSLSSPFNKTCILYESSFPHLLNGEKKACSDHLSGMFWIKLNYE